MKIEIADIKEKGTLSKERVLLNVLSDIDIGKYMIYYTRRASDNSFFTKPILSHWFVDKNVKKGDLIVLYTKSGKETEKLIRNNENTTHFFYMNEDEAFFDSEDKIIVAIELNNWETK